MNKLKFSSDFDWFRPYVKKVKHIVPLEQLEKIISVRPRTDQIQHGYAQLVTEYHGNGHVKRRYISINTHYCKLMSLKPLKRKALPFSKIDLLESLAHELAHLTHHDHTPDHKKLECRIKSIFMTQLEREGYISEEVELTAL